MLGTDFLSYNALDAACTLQCREAFWDQLAAGGYENVYQLTTDLLPVLGFMQTRGIRVNLKELEQTKQNVLRRMAEKQEELNKLCGRALNVNSPKDCQTYFYVEKGITPYYNDGSVTTDDKAMQRIARGTAKRSGLREARLVQEIRGLSKLNGTYLDMQFDEDERMRSSYNCRGTKFGRLSSSKTVFGTGGNAQNIPQEFKQFLVADPGYALWEVDKRQAEWVVVAYLTGDANMIAAVESGEDTHIRTASLMFGLEKELVAYDNKIVGNNSDSEAIRLLREADQILSRFIDRLPRTMSARQCGKKSNHGLNYDEGPNTFALTNEIEIPESKRIIAMYHAIYPGIRVWYDAVKRQLQAERSLTNYFGRKVRFMEGWGDDLFKAAYSMLPQSTVVDSLNIGMVKAYNDPFICGSSACNLDILAQVHDSILFQVPLPLLADSQRFAEVQERIYNYVSPEICYGGRCFKIATDAKLGLNWGGFHTERNPRGMRELKDAAEAAELVRSWSQENGSGT